MPFLEIGNRRWRWRIRVSLQDHFLYLFIPPRGKIIPERNWGMLKKAAGWTLLLIALLASSCQGVSFSSSFFSSPKASSSEGASSASGKGSLPDFYVSNPPSSSSSAVSSEASSSSSSFGSSPESPSSSVAQPDFVFSKSSDGLSYLLTKYNGAATEVTVPSSYQTLPVSGIGPDAFQSRQDITQVVLPSSLKTIGANAFGNCESLKTIALPDGLTTIRDRKSVV